MTDLSTLGPLIRDDIQRVIRSQMPDVIAELRAKAAEHGPLPREAGYTIHNAAGDTAVVRIYDEIWALGVNALDLAADLDAITAPEMRVEINSPGGNVFDGIAIFNALRMHPAKVTTRVDGIAASIASVIAQAGDHRIMVDSSQMMIHNAWGMAIGNADDHAEMASILAHQDGIIAGIYASKSETPADEFRDLMSAETWLTAADAVGLGLADEVFTPAAAPQDRALLTEKISTAVSAVEDAVSSAETVSAIRAEAGKTLSGAARESLSGLRDHLGRIDGLLQDGTPELDPELAAMRDEALRRSAAYLLPL